MSEPKTTPEETRWTRYRPREKPEIEYEVETNFVGDYRWKVFNNEFCCRIRTVRNLYFTEQVHQPAFTFMPAEGFLEVYAKVES